MPLLWKSHIRSLFYEQLDDLGGRTLRWNSNEIKFFLHTSLSLNFKQSHHLQPHTVHIQNPRWKKWGLGVEDCGNDGGEFELQVKIAAQFQIEKPLGICVFFFNKIGTLQAGHQTPSKRGAVGGKHQRVLQWPGGRLYFLLNFVYFLL